MTSERIKCPSCGVALLLPVPLRGSRGTCPRCLAEVTALEARREADAVQTDRPERREGALSCPHCGRTVEAIWITCPWCEEPLRGRERGRNGAADLDVRRDTKRTGWLLVLLAVIGGPGVGYLGLWPLVGGVEVIAEGNYSELVYVAVALLPLLFLAGLSTLIVFVRSRGNPGASGVRRVIVGTLALAGAITLVSLLLCLAFEVFLFIACSPMFR
ncbi:MAG TPA: hypothetical protein DDY78_04125 [Planctomycetales bacterium]|nr:hypothetical protein [Planctomycetales bacterium]